MSLTRTSSGLILQEEFSTGSGWSNPGTDANWSVAPEVGFVVSPRSPIPILTPSGLFAGGVREFHPFIDDDGLTPLTGTQYVYFSGGDNTGGAGGPWRIQYMKSTDQGKTWVQKGYTSFDLQKTDNPADGFWPCRDMLFLAKFAAYAPNPYFIYAMSGANDPTLPMNPIGPLEADVFQGPTAEGPWTFIRRISVIGGTGTFNDLYFTFSAVLKSGGLFHAFQSAESSLVENLTSGYSTASTPAGPFSEDQIAWYNHKASSWIGENLKPVIHAVSGKIVVFANDCLLLDTNTHANWIHVADSLTDWTRNVRSKMTQIPSPADGDFEIGLGSPYYLPEGEVVQSDDGHIPFIFDTDPNGISTYKERLNHHKGYSAVAECSPACAKYTPGALTFADGFNRSNRSIAGDNGWTQPYGTFTAAISSFKLDMGSVSGDMIVVQPGLSIQDVSLQALLTLGANAGVGFIARYVDQNNFYLVNFASASSGFLAIDIFTKVTGSYASIHSVVDTHLWNPGDTHTCRITIKGATLSAFFDDEFITSVNDSTFAAAGAVGLRSGNVGATTRLVDEFYARTLNGAFDRFTNTPLAHTDLVGRFSPALRTINSLDDVGIDFRIQANGDSYRLKLAGTLGLVLQKSTGGSGGVPGAFSNLQVGSGTQIATISMQHRVKWSAIGNTIIASLDGEEQINFSDTSSPYLLGVAIALVGANTLSEVRHLSLCASDSITINGLTAGDVIDLRPPGGVTIVETIVAAGGTDVITPAWAHYPIGSIYINGVQAFP